MSHVRGAVDQRATRCRGEVSESRGGDPIVDRLFLSMPVIDVDDGKVIIRAGQPVLLIRRGFAYRSYAIGGHKKSTTDILLPGDITGIDQLHVNKARAAVVAAGRVSYQTLGTGVLRTWMEDPSVSMRIATLLVEIHWRAEWLVAVQRVSALERLASLFIRIHQRLRERNLIDGMSYNLPLTHRRIADYLDITPEHLSRTLCRMRERQLVNVEKHVVTILDFRGLHKLMQGPTDPDSAPP